MGRQQIREKMIWQLPKQKAKRKPEKNNNYNPIWQSEQIFRIGGVKITDMRTDVWSQVFIKWKFNSGLWAVVWDGLWNKRVWAYYDQLLRPVFLSFYGQKINLKFFWNYFRIRTEKLDRRKVNETQRKFWKVFFMGEKPVFLGLKIWV